MRRLLVLSLLALLLIPGSSRAEEDEEKPSYLGSDTCRRCHVRQYQSWEGTQMARALESLGPGSAVEAKEAAGLDPDRDYASDSKCLACHATGFGRPGGFVDAETTPDRAGVGCEACHGPAEAYRQESHMSIQNRRYERTDLVEAGLLAGDEDTCRHCHDGERPCAGNGGTDFRERDDSGVHEHFDLKYEH